MQLRRTVLASVSALILLVPALSPALHAQDDQTAHRGRKYKAPPATSHIEVVVTKQFNSKPIPNAAVVFDATLDGKDQGNLEVKTDPDGKATIDIIPTGSVVRVQVIATGFATFAQEYPVDGPSKSIAVAMVHPQAQVSNYVDNTGKAATRKPGIQEPIRPTPTPPPPPSTAPQP
jgi:hypothetical protein